MVEREKRGDIEFWALTGVIERVKIKVVLRSIKGGKKHFYSVVWQGEEKSGRNKNGAVSRLLQRHRGLVTPQLQEKYNTFTAQMSSLILKSTGKVFDVPSKAWSRFQPNCGVWRNVSDIKEGSYIAVATGISPISNHPNGRAKFERITKIELLPPQQVWDIQIANTRNFVGNDIIAHNTYITGNLGLGILPPSTGWTSTIEIIMNFSKNNEHIL
jgi:hypothetical protein